MISASVGAPKTDPEIRFLEDLYMEPEINFVSPWINFCLHYFFVLRLAGMKRPIKNVNNPEPDIETSTLEAIMQTFIEEVLR